METFWLLLAIALVVTGFAGTIIPMLPGVPLIFGGFLVWGLASGWKDYTVQTVVILGIVTAVIWLLEYYAGAIGAKKYGASKAGVWGTVLGGIIGVFAFNILGLVAGSFLGAVIGELVMGRPRQEAWRAGWGAFVGFLAGSAIKIIAGIIMGGLFFYWLIV